MGLLVRFAAGKKVGVFNSGLRGFKTATLNKYLHLLPKGFGTSTTTTLLMAERNYQGEFVQIKALERKGKSPIKHICENAIKNALNNGFKAQFGYEGAQIVDAFIMCVPTPLNKYREPDISFIIKSIEAIMPCLRSEQLIALESTTYPGTTEEELLPRIESSGMTVGEDIFLVFSPEREDPGNKQYTTSKYLKFVEVLPQIAWMLV